jgi:serine/threonine protein phosphatase PrpC
MRTGLLRGRDHTLLGGVAVLAEGRVAIALSRGGAAKTYRHRDVNEDAALFAWSEHAQLLAVADGHWGSEGAALALDRIVTQHAPRWLGASAEGLAAHWPDEGPALAVDLGLALVRERVGRTTLSLCLVRPAEGWLLGLAVGDSHLFHVGDGAVRELCARDASDRTVFLGDSGLEAAEVAAASRTACEPAPAGGALLLATDGLSEPGIGVEDPAAAAAESAAAAANARAELRPLEAARRLAEIALAAHRRQQSGDNVAVACAWLD